MERLIIQASQRDSKAERSNALFQPIFAFTGSNYEVGVDLVIHTELEVYV